MPDRAAGHAEAEKRLRACPRASGLRRLAAAAGRPCGPLRRRRQFRHRGGAGLPTRSGQRLARFTEVKPSETEQGLTASLAEEADYDPTQARLAGIQRLLVLAGYDANPIDGLRGKKTETALAQFLKDRKLPADAASGATFSHVLIEAVKTGRRRLFLVQRDGA